MHTINLPNKTDPPLAIDPNTMLTRSIPMQSFKQITRRHTHV
jgi:hypothetical protein